MAARAINWFVLQRAKAGLTAGEVARRLGLSRLAVGNWESGRSVPRAQMWGRIADLFGCSIEEVAGQCEALGRAREQTAGEAA